MALSDDARVALARVAAEHETCAYPMAAPCARCDYFGRKALAAVLPDGRTIAQALDEGQEWRRWGKALAEPALRAIQSQNPEEMDAAFAAISRWEASQ